MHASFDTAAASGESAADAQRRGLRQRDAADAAGWDTVADCGCNASVADMPMYPLAYFALGRDAVDGAARREHLRRAAEASWQVPAHTLARTPS